MQPVYDSGSIGYGQLAGPDIFLPSTVGGIGNAIGDNPHFGSLYHRRIARRQICKILLDTGVRRRPNGPVLNFDIEH
jgi:hypothetical protein